jgi:hypothetical protein
MIGTQLEASDVCLLAARLAASMAATAVLLPGGAAVS